jgi:hypothetical protein
MRTVVAYQNWVFDFLRTMVMNPKNHPKNLWGSVPASNNHPILVTSFLPTYICVLYVEDA